MADQLDEEVPKMRPHFFFVEAAQTACETCVSRSPALVLQLDVSTGLLSW